MTISDNIKKPFTFVEGFLFYERGKCDIIKTVKSIKFIK